MGHHFSIDSVIEEMANIWFAALTARDADPYLTSFD
jgi:hypothetical protein